MTIGEKIYHCPNRKNGCNFKGTKKETIKHIRTKCSYGSIHDEYNRSDDNIFDDILSSCLMMEAFTTIVSDTSYESIFSGNGGESGGGGASGSWESSDPPDTGPLASQDSNDTGDSSSDFDSGGGE